jgi:hypothetical protein
MLRPTSEDRFDLQHAGTEISKGPRRTNRIAKVLIIPCPIRAPWRFCTPLAGEGTAGGGCAGKLIFDIIDAEFGLDPTSVIGDPS